MGLRKYAYFLPATSLPDPQAGALSTEVALICRNALAACPGTELSWVGQQAVGCRVLTLECTSSQRCQGLSLADSKHSDLLATRHLLLLTERGIQGSLNSESWGAAWVGRVINANWIVFSPEGIKEQLPKQKAHCKLKPQTDKIWPSPVCRNVLITQNTEWQGESIRW